MTYGRAFFLNKVSAKREEKVKWKEVRERLGMHAVRHSLSLAPKVR